MATGERSSKQRGKKSDGDNYPAEREREKGQVVMSE
jgi:hypothetical protein